MYLKCDPEIARYYRRLAAKEGVNLVAQRIDCHVSVIRTEELSEDLPSFLQGEEVEVFGNPEYMQRNKTHYWFRVISPRLEEIRLDLGFSNQPVEIVNNKIITHPFHLTVGVIKEIK